MATIGSYTHGHCSRVAEYGVAIAGALGLDAGQVTTLRIGAYLHDLGKVRVPQEVLNKPGRLTGGITRSTTGAATPMVCAVTRSR